MGSQRGLLYGVVALQAALIDPQHFSEFVEASREWDTQRDGPFTDLLVKRGWIRPSDGAHVDYLVERKLQAHAGDAKASMASVTHEIERSLGSLRSDQVQQSLTGSPGASSPMTLASEVKGSPAGDRYELSSLHATGGIGRVWRAHDGQMGRDVALKELRPEQGDDPVVCARFLREAQITGQLEHPGIVPVYELARRTDTGRPYYTMRFVKGRTLSEAAKAYHQKRAAGQVDPLEFSTLLNAFVVVCKTIAYAHSRGVIHRDLKGQNVVVGEFGEVVVLDWGLAKRMDRSDKDTDRSAVTLGPEEEETGVELTRQGDALGTPAYMAPEQAAGRVDLIDRRTDVYGLGAMLYQLLTGQSPFSGATVSEVLKKVASEEVVPPQHVWAEVPPTLQAACLRALVKEPSGRFASASDLAHEVEQWQEVQRQQAEDALRVVQAIYHSLVESIPLWVWRKDLDSRFTFVSHGLAKGIGLTPETMIGKTDHDFFPSLADQIRRDDIHVITTGETLRLTEERTADEKVPRFVEVIKMPIRDSKGAIVGTQGVLWDMTTWKRTEEALRESEALYQSLVESSLMHTWRKDAAGRFVFVNKGFCEALGKGRDALIGKTDFDLFPAELAQKYQRDDAQVLQTGQTLRVTEVHPSRHVVEVIKIPIRDAHGRIVGTQGIYWDLTAWNRTEAKSPR